MKSLTTLIALTIAFTAQLARADDAISAAQQKLKDQGFYYGEVSGKKDTDTIAAIRRYQIRNGLSVTGEMDAETQKSLGVRSQAAAAPKPTATPAPYTFERPAVSRGDETNAPPPSDSAPGANSRGPAEYAPDGSPNSPPGFAPGPRGLRPEASGIMDGTPFEVAPAVVQRQVIVGAQSLLARRGFYRSGIDGVYGPGTEFAVRAFQARAGLEPSGRLDMETLAALGLLPGQRHPGFGSTRRRFFPAPRRPVVRGEWVPED